jgi:hypothetical protein
MNLIERRTNLLQQINGINDEQTLEMLQETLAYYAHTDNKDITDGLDKYQFQQLQNLVEEPGEENTITEEEFRKLFARWGTK